MLQNYTKTSIRLFGNMSSSLCCRAEKAQAVIKCSWVRIFIIFFIVIFPFELNTQKLSEEKVIFVKNSVYDSYLNQTFIR